MGISWIETIVDPCDVPSQDGDAYADGDVGWIKTVVDAYADGDVGWIERMDRTRKAKTRIHKEYGFCNL